MGFELEEEGMCVDPWASIPLDDGGMCVDPGASVTRGSEDEVCVDPGVSAEPEAPPLDATNQCIDPSSVTEPTVIKSSLGNTTVYPDDFVGPLPPGAVRASQHAKMVELFDRVSGGQSQLKIDTSNFTDGKSLFTDPLGYMKGLIEGEAFREQQLSYMRDLVKTDAGFQMMSDMDTSKFTTTIQAATTATNKTNYDDIDAASMQADGKKGAGSNITISMNPALQSYARPGEKEQAWMTERPKYGLYHEMVHAWHGIQGDRATGRHNGINNSEWQAMGMGAPFAKLPVSDNIIRAQMGKERRPNYGGKTY